jgi:transcriptional regulator with XRE-family HTH domain
MESLTSLRTVISERRKALRLRQADLAAKAEVSLATIKALEQGRMGELGYSKIVRILAALGLELKVQDASGTRPTLDELRSEAEDESGDDR